MSDITFPPELDAPGHVFLTGRAGTGKTTLIRQWVEARRRTLDIAIVAPTGVAALNLGGQTIHRFLNLHGRSPARMEARHAHGERYRRLDAIVLDEVSMCRSDLMDAVDIALRAARHDSRPFGGVRMIMVGDLLQLPPVVTGEDRTLFAPPDGLPGPWFFQSNAIRRILAKGQLSMIELTQVRRQNDPLFIKTLNYIRGGHPGVKTLDVINRRAGLAADPRAIILTADNRKADRLNSRRLDMLPGPRRTWRARTVGRWDGRVKPTSETLTLTVGARVMATCNDPDGQYVNGSTGTVTQIDGLPWVRFDDGPTIPVGRHRWSIYENTIRRERVERVETGRYEQIPLKLGWAVTIHKSQGMTFDRVAVDWGERPLFAPGQAYVALSRARTLDGLTMSRPLTPRDVTASQTAVRFIRSMRTHNSRHAADIPHDLG